MEDFKLQVQVRWSDLDPNFHLRHSVYYDWGAFCRVNFFAMHGLDTTSMKSLQLGPILFREECVFRKEIRSEDVVHIDLKLIRARKDISRWSIQHHITKNTNLLAAVITVDGAWINMSERKLAAPHEKVIEVFNAMPKADDFEWI
jgi:acyl-CoA thioester hydrolase